MSLQAPALATLEKIYAEKPELFIDRLNNIFQ
jgi:hypothetical protein